MQTPGFWRAGSNCFPSTLLSPFGWFFRIITWVRQVTTKPWKSPIPIICIGNLVAGGSGKTPLALNIAKHLQKKGKIVHFLSRGYGGEEKGPLLVDVEIHDFTCVGDEPLILASQAPTWVSRDRRAGCLAAAKAGAEIIIMDDGFQNPKVIKDYSIVVVDGEYGFGNQKLIPAGPLREPIPRGLARAHAVVVVGEDRAGTSIFFTRHGLSPLSTRLIPTKLPNTIKDKPVVLFAGIGFPEKFFKTISNLGYNVVRKISYADHHPYSCSDIDYLRNVAKKNEAILLSTEKDAQRLPKSFLKEVNIISAKIEWEFDEKRNILLNEIISV